MMTTISTIAFILGGAIALFFVFEKLETWISNQIAKRTLAKIMKDVKAGNVSDPRILEKAKYGVISIKGAKVYVKTGNHESDVEWDKIDKIVCYKEDLWTYDLACIGFSYADDQPMVVVTEEMSGFVDLQMEMEKVFPGLDDQYHQWLFGTRAFDTRMHILWDRKNQGK